MSRLLSTIVLLAVLLTSGAYADDCTVQATENETATLSYLSGNVTISTGTTQDIASINFAPCGSGTQTFPNCPNVSGYVATYKADGSCDTVYTHKDNTTYDELLKDFNTRYYTDDGQHHTIRSIFGVQELFVRVHCVVVADTPDAQILSNGTIFIRTDTVCAGYTPPATPAPEAEKEGLSTGAIVGIVIGALAILVIVLVIFRWKAQKGEDEGEYQRV